MPARFAAARMACLLLAASIMGCGVDLEYLIPAAGGQINLILRSVPIDQALADDSLSDAQQTKLEMIRDARAYTRDVVGLNVENNFTRFYNAGDEPVAFNVSASRKDAFVPRLWSFPIVGTVPYLGYFDRSAADAKFDELAAEDLDVFMYEIDAFSGLGFIPTLVLSPMLERSEVRVVETVFHELLHSTVWRENDTSFNESLATFVGRTGAIEFFAERHPGRPELIQEAIETFEDTDRYSDAMLELFNDLDAFYSSDLGSEDKIAGRDAVYQAGRDRFAAEVQPLMNRPERYDWVSNIPTNNAWMLGVRRYNLDLDVFEQVFAATGEDWFASLSVFGAASARDDPYTYLRAWLTSASDFVAKAKIDPNTERQRSGSTTPTSRPASRLVCPARLPTTILQPG